MKTSHVELSWVPGVARDAAMPDCGSRPGMGRRFIGAELTAHYQQVARERIEAAIVGYRDDGVQGVLEAVTA